MDLTAPVVRLSDRDGLLDALIAAADTVVKLEASVLSPRKASSSSCVATKKT
ncbi:MAG: hypothetical protein M5R38_03460 [Candidatus Methylomirabilis sp.]|nr:hypothetical protein [Candidatus Methylomirabilis sp.]